MDQPSPLCESPKEAEHYQPQDQQLGLRWLGRVQLCHREHQSSKGYQQHRVQEKWHRLADRSDPRRRRYRYRRTLIDEDHMKPIARYMEEMGISLDQLVESAGLDAKLVAAIVSGNYTPSPSQRQRLAAALGVAKDEISWEHAVPVQHLRGNGPQSGRST